MPSEENPMNRRIAVATVVAACALALIGCGPSRHSGSPPAAPEPGGVAPAPPKSLKVAWAPNFGPVSQNQPPMHRWYEMVRTRSCSELMSAARSPQAAEGEVVYHIYHGLAAACLNQWNQAGADMAALNADHNLINAIETDDGTRDCFLLSSLLTLQRLVQAHETAGDATIEIEGPAEATCHPPAGALESGNQ
jgi:hypothetical protein